jgi:hypothetical protein
MGHPAPCWPDSLAMEAQKVEAIVDMSDPRLVLRKCDFQNYLT